MTDLAAGRHIIERFPALNKREKWALDTAVARILYKGGPVMLDVNVDTTHIIPFTSAVTPASNDVTIGIAMEGAEVALGDPETTEVTVLVHGEVGFKAGTLTDADVGKTVYFSDSQVLSISSGLEVGKIVRVADGYVYILINPTTFIIKS